jgi:hypothetical protein
VIGWQARPHYDDKEEYNIRKIEEQHKLADLSWSGMPFIRGMSEEDQRAFHRWMDYKRRYVQEISNNIKR